MGGLYDLRHNGHTYQRCFHRATRRRHFPALGGMALLNFGLALVIIAAAPPVIAGHYNLFQYDPGRVDRPPTTTQEKWPLRVVSVAIGA